MRLLINRARRERRGKVLPFKKPALKRTPYRPSAANGECYAIKSHLVEYDTEGNEVAFGAVYAAIHMSASGDSVGGPGGGFATMAEAEQAAWREARRRNAIFVFSTAKEIGHE
jgi:hypothetical protein